MIFQEVPRACRGFPFQRVKACAASPMEYVRKFLHLLELERAAEEAENRAYISEQLVNPKQLESRGICIQKLQVPTHMVKGRLHQTMPD